MGKGQQRNGLLILHSEGEPSRGLLPWPTQAMPSPGCPPPAHLPVNELSLLTEDESEGFNQIHKVYVVTGKAPDDPISSNSLIQ